MNLAFHSDSSASFCKTLSGYVAVLLILWVIPAAFAQPSGTPPPGLLIKVETAGRLQGDQAAELVYLEDVSISELQRLESQSGRTHLTFSINVSGERFSAIMYEGEWGEAEEAILGAGTAHLIGLWGEYNGAPSLTTKWVENAESSDTAITEILEVADQQERELVLIEEAAIAEITKFVSRSLKMHVRFTLQVPGDERVLSGVVYEGNWNSDTLEVLRSGNANLVGYWEEYQGEPSFVLVKLE